MSEKETILNKKGRKKEDVLEIPEEKEEVLIDEFEPNEDDFVKDEDTLFPNGPTYDNIDEWKSRYNGEIYMTDFEEGEIYIWRPLTRKEYRDIINIEGSTAFYREERICQVSIVWPTTNLSSKLRTTGKAGIPSMLSELILEKSGYNPNTRTMAL